MNINIENLCTVLNEKKQGYIAVGDTKVALPIVEINGESPGKTVVLTAGIHGAEYTGIQTLVELAQEIQTVSLHGSVILLPIANPSGFRKIAPWNVPEDNNNLNRMFPGEKDGSLSQQIAYVITQILRLTADFYIDLHAGDLYEQLTPYVYYPGAALQEVSEASCKAASVLSVPYRVRSTATTGAYNSAAIMGVPSLLIERGGRGQWSPQEVDDYKKDVYSVLSHLGVIKQTEVEKNIHQKEISDVRYPTAHVDGLWYPFVKSGQSIKKGELLGEIRNCFGELLENCIACDNGVVLYLTETLSISKDNITVAYGIT